MMTETAYRSYADTIQKQSWTDTHTKEADMPWYVRFGHEVRSTLRDIDPEVSVCPSDIQSVEDLFTRSKKIAKREWANAVLARVWDVPEASESLRDQWVRGIHEYEVGKDPDINAIAPLKQALATRENFFHILTHNGSSVLETLGKINPENWIAFLSAYSEREMAAIELARRWIVSMPSEVSDRLSPVMNREELLLVVKLSALTKYPDHAMIKLFDLMKDGRLEKKTAFAKNDGIQYLFEIRYDPDEDELQKKPGESADEVHFKHFVSYRKMFPKEWKRLVIALRGTGRQIRSLMSQDRIPTTYAPLSDYLTQLSNAYGSTVIRPGQLNRMWRRAEQSGVALQQSDCPIVVHPMGAPSITEEANKIDPEFSVSLHLPAQRILEEDVSVFIEQATAYAARLKKQGIISRLVPPVSMLFHVASGGSNIFWQIQGISGEFDILCFVNRIKEEFTRDYLPIIERLVGHALTPEEIEKYLRICIVATGAHELGHALVSIEDPKIKPKIGLHASIYSFDEVKADSTTAWFKNENDISEEDARMFIHAYMAWCLHYMKTNLPHDGSSGLQYYMLGIVELAKILEYGNVKIYDTHVEIGTPLDALRALSDLSVSLRGLCASPMVDGEQVKDTVRTLRKQAEMYNIRLTELLRFVRLQ